MHWSVEECLKKFQLIVKEIFKRRNPSSSLFARIQELLLSYVEDGQYSQSALDSAFGSQSGLKMFNPLRTSTKVAVTATSAKGTKPCLFTNFNGRQRAEDPATAAYEIIRASKEINDATVSDA
jgi:hypothetical protein